MEQFRSDLKTVFHKIVNDYDIEIIGLEIPVDHVQMVVRAEPKDFSSNSMQKIKAISARQIQAFSESFSGVESFELKATSLKRLPMRMKK